MEIPCSTLHRFVSLGSSFLVRVPVAGPGALWQLLRELVRQLVRLNLKSTISVTGTQSRMGPGWACTRGIAGRSPESCPQQGSNHERRPAGGAGPALEAGSGLIT
jgi:hypothetical protein